MSAPRWTAAEIDAMRALSLEQLRELPPSPSNRVADDMAAARFGQALFFDSRLSGNGLVSCMTCHQPARRFTDGRQKGQAIGTTERNTPSIVGTAMSPWQYWDGRRDSLWSQALTPLEHPAEHGGNRLAYARFVAGDAAYRPTYEALFGPLPDFANGSWPDAASPLGSAAERRAWSSLSADQQRQVDRVFTNLGKAIAAYERRLRHGPARFDRYVAAVVRGDPEAQQAVMSTAEAQGLRLFLGKARCTECHNGPLLTNNEFHNNGVLSYPGETPDRGRIDGLRTVLEDPFNCRGDFNDEPDPYCGELEFARDGIELIGAMRTPSLRNLQHTAPYMHKGQLETLAEVIDHYNDAPLAMIGHNEAEVPLGLNLRERRQLEAFLHTLDSPIDADPSWLAPPTGHNR